MLGLITSDRVVAGVVVGVPLVVLALIVVASRPGIANPVVAGASAVAAVLIAVMIWSVFRPGQPTVAAGAQLATLPTAPAAPASPPPSTKPSPASPAAPACSPSGSTIQIAAKGIAFDKSCLAAPAGSPFSIVFDNQDAGIPHNVDVLSGPGGTHVAAANGPSDIVTGVATDTYQVAALDPGTYYFQCDIHPNMHGTFVVA
ncbi:MAG TPA: cupredoxin domain-containing protein [Actinomycetota bacterium]|nr:cupredoxin domain-containing protein [Actinomycetota bacterium]